MMKLDKYIDINEMLSEITYTRDGKDVKLDISSMCTVDHRDEVSQLREVSGNTYFLIRIQTEVIEKKASVETDLLAAKNKLTQLKGTLYLKTSTELAESKARVTEKVLESRVNDNVDIASINKTIVNLTGVASQLSGIESLLRGAIKSLILKQEALLEISRRHKQELNSINKLQ